MAELFRRTRIEKFIEKLQNQVDTYQKTIEAIDSIHGKGNELSNQLKMQQTLTSNIIFDLKKEFEIFDTNNWIPALENAAIGRSPVYTTENNRGSGKTSAVVEFAKKHGFTALVMLPLVAKDLREKYDYPNVFSVSEANQLSGLKIVYDEGIDTDIMLARGADFEVVTGFRFTEEVIRSLESTT